VSRAQITRVLSLIYGKKFLIGTVLYKTKSLDGTTPNTNPKTNHDLNTNPIQLFCFLSTVP